MEMNFKILFEVHFYTGVCFYDMVKLQPVIDPLASHSIFSIRPSLWLSIEAVYKDRVPALNWVC